MTLQAQAKHETARVNGVPLNPTGQPLPVAELRQRACAELLRQAAVARGLLAADDAPGADGVLSAAATQAIEALLERELVVTEPSEAECRRYHAANPQRFARGARVHARHILFAVTPGVDVEALRQRAEACLADVSVRGRDSAEAAGERFTRAAATLSNCPSGANGGDLGWLETADCAPEFAREVFEQFSDTAVGAGLGLGVIPRLVHSRFGLHVVEVLAREEPVIPDFDEVRGALAGALRHAAYATALRRYLGELAEQADVVGVDLGLGAPLDNGSGTA